MIIKIQISLNDGGKMAVIYDREYAIYRDEGKGHIYHGPNTKIIRRLMGRRIKAFFYADLKNNVFKINGPAPWQSW